MKTIAAVLALVLLAAPVAQAHGAPEAREIDTRILADQTSNGDYGGSFLSGVAPMDEGGLDLLALDVYEGTLPGTTTPAAVFRVIVQGGAADDHVITITFDAGGSSMTLDLQTSDLATYTSSTFPIVRGPFDVGDGHPKAIEGVIGLAALGIAPGDALENIVVQSRKAGTATDDMPGSWYYAGTPVPLAPTTEAGPAGTWRLDGPDALFLVESGGEVLKPVAGEVTVSFNLSSPLTTMEQFLSLNVSAPPGITARLSAATAMLEPGDATSIDLTVSGVGSGDVRILIESDLGVARAIAYPLAGGGERGNGGNIESPLFGQGESFTYTFTDPATFEYHCHPHPWMQATITIGPDDANNAPAIHVVKLLEHDGSDPNSWAFEPAALVIEANDTVIWVNDGRELHTVHGSTGLGVGGHDHDHDHGDDGKESPGAFVLLPLLIALLRRR